MRPARFVVAALLLVSLASHAAAQHRQAAGIALVPATGIALIPATKIGLVPAQDSIRRATPWAVAASAVVPGAGQALLGQKRSIAYGVVEGLLLLRYVGDRRDGNRSRDRYRLLAHDVARAQFADERPVGSFDYYERMSKFEASGAFDAMPGGGIDPETDPTTYNGAMWQLARETYWIDPSSPPPRESPEYQRALALYRARAYADAYRWSWTGATAERDEFRRAIRRSNSEFRHAATDLGFLIANHVLSSIDAFVEVRLRRRDGPAGDVEVRATVPFAVFDGRRNWRGPGGS